MPENLLNLTVTYVMGGVRVKDPVGYLMLAIIYQALKDVENYAESDSEKYESALTFLKGEDYQAFCDYLGIKPSQARRALEILMLENSAKGANKEEHESGERK